MKKIIDERQNYEQLKVLKTGFWTMWTILLISFIYNAYFLQTIRLGELTALMAGSVIELIGNARIGVWDNYLKPNVKNYFIVGCIVAALVIVLSAVSGLQRNPLVLVIVGTFAFLAAFVINWLMGSYAKRQSEKDVDDEE